MQFPDGSFIRSGRLPNEALPRGHIRVVPDLVLAVVSPNDLAWEVDMQVTEYLQAGVPLLWVFYPDTRTVSVYRADGKAARLGVDETLSGADVFPHHLAAPAWGCTPPFLAPLSIGCIERASAIVYSGLSNTLTAGGHAVQER